MPRRWRGQRGPSWPIDARPDLESPHGRRAALDLVGRRCGPPAGQVDRVEGLRPETGRRGSSVLDGRGGGGARHRSPGAPSVALDQPEGRGRVGIPLAGTIAGDIRPGRNRRPLPEGCVGQRADAPARDLPRVARATGTARRAAPQGELTPHPIPLPSRGEGEGSLSPLSPALGGGQGEGVPRRLRSVTARPGAVRPEAARRRSRLSRA